mmetsp:Transcript_27844/g.37015  ORF Transcript_27844/g.37015 Transcript_27844/m.37015 type:complete len:150 (+) Transcript_27844:131-580(+)
MSSNTSTKNQFVPHAIGHRFLTRIPSRPPPACLICMRQRLLPRAAHSQSLSLKLPLFLALTKNEAAGSVSASTGAVGDEVGEALGGAVGETLGDKVGGALGDKVGEALGDKVGEALGDKVGEAVCNAVGFGITLGPADSSEVIHVALDS